MPKAFDIQARPKLLYSFLEYLMINEQLSNFLQYFHFIVSELQYLAILVWMQNALFASDDLNPASVFTYKFSTAIIFKHFFEYQLPISFLEACSVALCIYFSVIYIVLVYLWFKALRASTVKKSLLKEIHIVFLLHYGFIFWIANMVFMVLISLKNKGIAIPMFSFLEDEEGAFYSIQIFLITLNYVLGIISAIFCFDPFCSGNLFSVQSSLFQFLTFLFKAIIAPVLIFSNPNRLSTQVIFIIIALATSTGRLFCVFRKFLFYYYNSMKIATIFLILSIWVSFTNIFAIIWLYIGWVRSMSLFYLIILPLPLIIKLCLTRLGKIIMFYVTVNLKMPWVKRQIFGKLFAYRALLDRVKLPLNGNIDMNYKEVYFIGSLVKHSLDCRDPECLCAIFTKDQSKLASTSILNLRNTVSTYLYSISVSLLTEAIEKIRNNSELKLELAHLIFTNPEKRLNSVLVYLFSTSDESLNFFMRIKKKILLSKIQEKISSYFSENCNEKLNMKRFVAYNNDVENFLSQILSMTDEYLSLWDCYKKPNISMRHILQKSENIEKKADTIEKLWNSNVEKYESFYELMKDPYKSYLNLVRNKPSASNDLIRKFQWKKKPKLFTPDTNFIREEDLADSKVLSFYVSMMKERLGKVVYASKNIQNSLGYLSEDLIGRNINYLMPTCFAENHDGILLEHLEKSRTSETKDYYNSTGYIRTKVGTILPCSVHITIFPYIQNELLYLGVIKVIAPKRDYLITDSLGYIDSFTEKIGKKLKLSLYQKKHIREICNDIDKLDIEFDDPNQNKRLNFIYSVFLEIKSQTVSHSHREKSMNWNPVKANKINSYPQNQFSLEFIKQDSDLEIVKYSTKFTRRTICDKIIYIFELKLEPYQLQKLKPVPCSQEIKTLPPDDPAFDAPFEISGFQQLLKSIETKDFSTIPQNLDSERLGLVNSALVKKAIDKFELNRNIAKKSASYLMVSNPTKFDSIREIFTDSENRTPRNRKVSNPSPNQNDKDVNLKEENTLIYLPAHGSNNGKLEEAIYFIPGNKPLKILIILAIITIIMSMSLLSAFYIKTNENLKLVKGNLAILNICSMRLLQIIEINRRTRTLSLYSNEFYNDKRYLSYGIEALVPATISLLNSTQEQLMLYNHLARVGLESIQLDLQKELFSSLIPIVDPDSETAVRYDTLFDAAMILLVRVKNLIKTEPAQITRANADMNFLLNNTLNEQILISERVIKIVLSDNTMNISFLKNMTMCFILISCVLNAFILTLFACNQFRFIQIRNKFLELFLKFNDDDVDYCMRQVRNFRNSLLKEGFEYKHISIQDIPLSPKSQRRSQKPVKGFGFKSREVNTRGLNYRFYLGLIILAMLALILLAPFVYLFAMISHNKNLLKQEVDTIVEVNSNFCDINLASTAILEYIQLNGTTKVRNQPIERELETIFERLSGFQDFFSKLTRIEEEDENTEDSVILSLLTKDLCKIINSYPSICELGKGMFEKGIIGINTFIMFTLRRTKDLFDASDRSFSNQKEILSLSSLIDIEYLYTIMQLTAHKRLEEILQNHVEKHIHEMNEFLNIAVISSILLYIVIGYLGLKILWRIVESERIKWRKLMRKIPFGIIATSKALKNYLVREFDGLLD